MMLLINNSNPVPVPMLINSQMQETLIIIYTYLFVYNNALMILFLLFFQILQFEMKATIVFNKFHLNPFLLTSLAVVIFSMAGVPPMTGFFTKVLILLAILNNSFGSFFLFFGILLLVSLYFYMQNIRFLYANAEEFFEFPHWNTIRIVPQHAGYIIVGITFLVTGFVFMEDMWIVFSWILN